MFCQILLFSSNRSNFETNLKFKIWNKPTKIQNIERKKSNKYINIKKILKYLESVRNIETDIY